MAVITEKEKIVYVKRKVSFAQAANNEPEVQEYFGMAYRAIGSFYKEFGRQFGSGLTRKEENILLPEVTGAYPDADKREFRSGIQAFYREINTKIPAEGLRLNIALEQDDDKDISEENMPVRIKDYLIYRHAMAHPQVAESLQEAQRYQHIHFYLDDPEKVTSDRAEVNKKEDESLVEYYGIVSDETKIDMMLTLLGIRTKGMDLDDKAVKLKELATAENELSIKENLLKLDKFISTAKDKDMAIKHEIESMVRVGILERVGMAVLIKETGDIIGKDVREAVVWFKDDGNGKDINVMRSQYKELAKK